MLNKAFAWIYREKCRAILFPASTEYIADWYHGCTVQEETCQWHSPVYCYSIVAFSSNHRIVYTRQSNSFERNLTVKDDTQRVTMFLPVFYFDRHECWHRPRRQWTQTVRRFLPLIYQQKTIVSGSDACWLTWWTISWFLTRRKMSREWEKTNSIGQPRRTSLESPDDIERRGQK